MLLLSRSKLQTQLYNLVWNKAVTMAQVAVAEWIAAVAEWIAAVAEWIAAQECCTCTAGSPQQSSSWYTQK